MTLCRRRRLGIIFALAMAPASPSGCARSGAVIPDAPSIERQPLYQPFVGGTGVEENLVTRPPYRLVPGDVLEIIYQVRNVVTDSPYELKIEDIIKIAFPYQEKFEQAVTVQGDGNIRCLLLGQVRAAGRTAGDLEAELRQSYGRYIREPELTVVVEAANVKISELKKAITTAPRGQSRLVPVKPDGTIDLPYIGEALVAGRTVNQAKRLLDARYAEEDLQEIEVTVQTLEFAPRRVYVMGEVMSPGMVSASAPMTLAQAIVHQGGPNPRADRSRILLVRRKWQPVPQALVFDMEHLLHAQKPSEFGRVPHGGLWRYDVYLEDGDIIWVPPTVMAVANDWIDQFFTRGIRAVFPYSGNIGLNFGYEIRNAKVPVENKQVDQFNLNGLVGP